MKTILLLLLLFSSIGAEPITKTIYHFRNEPIDVVIPCSPKDRNLLERCIDGIRKYGENIHRIIVISSEPYTDAAEWFDENRFPFSKKKIALELFAQDEEAAQQFLDHPKSRIGWIYQQFLKLYAPYVVPGISSNVLILDADVVFLNPISFTNEYGEPYFAVGKEFHEPYFQQAERLLPGLKRVYEKYSGVAHHMLFQKPILDDLQRMVYAEHKLELWKAICQTIDLDTVYQSSMSEYEIYFNFAFLRTDQAHLRHVKWFNSRMLTEEDFHRFQERGYRYVACHVRG